MIDVVTVDAGNDIPGLQARAFAGTLRLHGTDECAMRRAQTKCLRQLLIDFLNGDSDAAAADLALGQQLILDVQREIDGDGEGHSHVPAGTTVNLRIDADDLTVDIEQWSAGVAWIDGRIGLNERYIVFI